MRSLYVVVVDDEEQVRRLTARMLADVGCRVAEAHSGAAALALLAGSVQVDLVVSDISMPGMSGEVLAARIGERWPAVLILLISGQGYPNLGFLAPSCPGRLPRTRCSRRHSDPLAHQGRTVGQGPHAWCCVLTVRLGSGRRWPAGQRP
ncbi:MAG: response regulator [Gemmatimonadales bacterium]